MYRPIPSEVSKRRAYIAILLALTVPAIASPASEHWSAASRTTAAIEELDAAFQEIAHHRQLAIGVEHSVDPDATRCDPRIVKLFERAVEASGYPVVRLAQGATTDAINMALVAPIGSALIRCHGGVGWGPGGIVDTAAVDLVRSEPYDLVLMDVEMPVMDGIAATRSIRAIGGIAGRIPIVAMTAHVLPEQVATLRAAGADDHVSKPFNRTYLRAVIERCLSEARHTRMAS